MVQMGWKVVMRLDPINLYDYESRAKQFLPHNVWNEIESAKARGLSIPTATAFEALALRPRFLRDIRERDLSTTVLGTQISLPVMVCPAGGHRIACQGRFSRHRWAVGCPCSSERRSFCLEARGSSAHLEGGGLAALFDPIASGAQGSKRP